MDKITINILRLWKGDASVSKTFWGVFVPSFVFAVLVDRVLLVKFEQWAVLLSLPVAVLLMFSIVSVWRSTKNPRSSESPAPLVARIVVVLIGIPWALLYFFVFAAPWFL